MVDDQWLGGRVGKVWPATCVPAAGADFAGKLAARFRLQPNCTLILFGFSIIFRYDLDTGGEFNPWL
jgi:hypothetical protein